MFVCGIFLDVEVEKTSKAWNISKSVETGFGRENPGKKTGNSRWIWRKQHETTIYSGNILAQSRHSQEHWMERLYIGHAMANPGKNNIRMEWGWRASWQDHNEGCWNILFTENQYVLICFFLRKGFSVEVLIFWSTGPAEDYDARSCADMFHHFHQETIPSSPFHRREFRHHRHPPHPFGRGRLRFDHLVHPSPGDKAWLSWSLCRVDAMQTMQKMIPPKNRP